MFLNIIEINIRICGEKGIIVLMMVESYFVTFLRILKVIFRFIVGILKNCLWDKVEF